MNHFFVSGVAVVIIFVGAESVNKMDEVKPELLKKASTKC